MDEKDWRFLKVLYKKNITKAAEKLFVFSLP
ncbi:LysR family transcriptional regulator [Bacillus safensis FO-36b] [Bacillus safensis subsp. safensis]